MTTGVYIWFRYTKPTGSSASHIDWAGTIDTERAKKAIDKIKAEDMLKVQSSKFFSHNVKLSISMQEIKTGNVLYRREL
jgi:hypothetical protein